MKSNNNNKKEYNVFFRRNNKEKFWELENTVTLYDFKDLLKQILEKTKETKLEIKIEKTDNGED